MDALNFIRQNPALNLAAGVMTAGALPAYGYIQDNYLDPRPSGPVAPLPLASSHQAVPVIVPIRRKR